MEKLISSSQTVKFVLCIAEEMFARDSFLAYRPNPEGKFAVLGIPFICRNLKGKEPLPDEPAIGEIQSSKFKEARQTLLENSFLQLSVEEVHEINELYLTIGSEVVE